ncbi:DUF4240 domain-containing protein [uncultured Clostridium sp.]|uniref:DUF4240 domain-containing protein n=1 Tax=uncultured Clostridium sp. TaxID=59620 RepID=UPI0028F13DA0|nr:DUF4240 domain-containing protein [uncultured Clostridium sp.]
MKKNQFWKIIKMLDWSSEGNDDKVLAPVIQYLSEQSDEEIFEFENIMSKLLYDIDSKKIAMQLYGTLELFSNDLFLYQRCVAIVNGQGYYSSILYGGEILDPDLEFESILYVPIKAWAKKHQQDTSNYPHIAEPSYESCSNEELWKN